MSQQPLIDLLPDSVRKQCEIGARTGQIVGSILAGVLIVVVLATQARWQLDREQTRLAAATEAAEAVHKAQQEATSLARKLDQVRAYMNTYDRLALPLNLSSVIATVINELPPSVTIETLDLEAGDRRAARTSRGVTAEDTRPKRLLVGELSGFALTDDDIARLVMRLQNRESFNGVTLEFSRTRAVRDVVAREFRLSFRIDMSRPYEVVDADVASAGALNEMEVVR